MASAMDCLGLLLTVRFVAAEEAGAGDLKKARRRAWRITGVEMGEERAAKGRCGGDKGDEVVGG